MAAHGGEPFPPRAEWRVWLEARFLRCPVRYSVANAERTDFVPGILSDGDLTPFGKEQFAAAGVPWEEYFQAARENSAADLAKLKPKYVRNSDKVIEYAILTSEEPIVSSAVLAPKFLRMFADTLGPKVCVAVPSRYVAYIFPALVTDYQRYEPFVREAYEATPYPVSLELLEFSSEGIQAGGVFDR